MSAPVGFQISDDALEWCESEVSAGHFNSFSDVVDFSLRFLLISIRNGEAPSPRHSTRTTRKTARVNGWVLDELMAKGMFRKTEIADYAIIHLRDSLDK